MKFQVYQRQQLVYAGELDEAIELGRQQRTDERPFVRDRDARGWRVPIARIDETSVSRRHLRLEPTKSGRVRVTNLSAANTIRLGDGSVMAASASYEVELPTVLSVGDLAIRIEPQAEEEPPELKSLMQPTIVPGGDPFGGSTQMPSFDLSALVEKDTEGVVQWLQTVTNLLQSAANSNDFFLVAAQGVVDMIGLDSGRVLLCDGDAWRVVAEKISPNLAGPQRQWRPSNQILSQVQREKRTFWSLPDKASWSAASLADVESVVAAPILDRRGEVIGALYGDRLRNAGTPGEMGVTKLEAMLVETLAGGVATGLSRMDQEKATLAAEVRFEQFFPRELSQRLIAEPDLLKGRDAEVTLLFCDIRAFSRISERLGPAETFEWIGDVMSVMSERVAAHQFSSIDYIGDELVAMWGAPVERPEQAKLACLAAVDIIRAMPQLNQRWQSRVGEPIRVGIGINTGKARVGNTGSVTTFKYGPLGSTVNLASRVQGATKYLRSNVIITAATQVRLDPSFLTRRLCKVRVVNIAEPVDLYELAVQTDAGWATLRQAYEEALGDFEQQNFRQATSRLGRILGEYPDDGPSLVLLSRAVDRIVNPASTFDPAWELPGK